MNQRRARAAVIHLTNSERRRHGLPALHRHPLLMASAQAKARHIAATGVLEHGRWSQLLLNIAGHRVGLPIGENIADGQATAATVMYAWMNSPEHRANILRNQPGTANDYTLLGVGAAVDSRGTEWWVCHFAGPHR